MTDRAEVPNADRDPPPRWAVAVLVLAVLATFGRTAGHDFTTWDDNVTVAGNPRMNPPSAAGVAHYWTHPEYGLYVPLTYTAWSAVAAVAQVGEPDPFGVTLNPAVFHLLNVLLHAASAVAAFALIRRLTAGSDAAALAGAMVFALHPVQVESVAWVSGTKDVLAGLLGLMALYGYVRAVGGEAGGETRRERATFYAAATAALLLAMLSKPSAVAVPLMAIAADRLVLGRSWRDVARTAGPWLAMAAIVAVVAKLAQPAQAVEAAPLWARPLIAGDALAFYLGKLLWPFDLAIDYGRRPEAVTGRPGFYVAWLIPAAVATGLWHVRRRAPGLAAGGAWFALAVLPVLGLTPFLFQMYSTVADHYLYLAMVGPALAVARALSRRPSVVALSLAFAVTAMLAVRSFDQAWHWRDSGTLFSRAVAVNPLSRVGWLNLGSYHDARDDVAAAERMYRNAARVDPDHPAAYGNLALLHASVGRLDEAEAWFARYLERWRTTHPTQRKDLADELRRFGGLLRDAGAPDRAERYLDEADRW